VVVLVTRDLQLLSILCPCSLVPPSLFIARPTCVRSTDSAWFICSVRPTAIVSTKNAFFIADQCFISNQGRVADKTERRNVILQSTSELPMRTRLRACSTHSLLCHLRGLLALLLALSPTPPVRYWFRRSFVVVARLKVTLLGGRSRCFGDCCMCPSTRLPCLGRVTVEEYAPEVDSVVSVTAEYVQLGIERVQACTR